MRDPVILIGLNELSIFRKNGNSWIESIIDDDETSIDFYSALAFDSQNNAHIAMQGNPYGSQVDEAMMYFRSWPGLPNILLAQTSINFGQVWVQSYSQKNCSVRNTGDAPLKIEKLEFSSGQQIFSTNQMVPVFIMPGDSLAINIKFNPSTKIIYTDTLKIHSNDPSAKVSNILLNGEGILSGDQGDIDVFVNNIYFDSDNGILVTDKPVSSTEVTLLNGNQIIGNPKITDGLGNCFFSTVDTGSYTLRLIKGIHLKDGVTQKNITLNKKITVGPGLNSISVTFPESLFTHKYNLIYDLTHIGGENFGIPFSFSFENSEASVKQLLDGWITDLPENVNDNLVRLNLAEEMVSELFPEGMATGNEAINDVAELISFIYYSDEWGSSLIDILIALAKSIGNTTEGAQEIMQEIMQTLIREVIKIEIMNLVTDGIKQAAAPLDDRIEEVLLTVWNSVKEEYCGYPRISFSNTGWNRVKQMVYGTMKDAFFQEAYITLYLGPSITKAKNYSKNFSFNGTHYEAFTDKLNFVSNTTNDLSKARQVSGIMRETADLFMKTAGILDLIGKLLGGAASNYLEDISFYMKVSAYSGVTTAFGISSYFFLTSPADIYDNIDDIYFPDGKTQNPFVQKVISAGNDPILLVKQKQDLISKLNNYDNQLGEIKNHIKEGRYDSSLIALSNLWQADQDYRSSIMTTASPVYAVSEIAMDSIASFNEMYDSLTSSYAVAGEARLMNYLNIIAVGMDTSQSVKDMIYTQLDNSVIKNNILIARLNSIIDTVYSKIEIPAVLSISNLTQNKYSLEENETAEIKIKVKNAGGKQRRIFVLF